MTAVDWVPTLQDRLVRARSLLEASDPAAAEEAGQALRQASDALTEILLESGLDTPFAWRLHELRNRLDAHLLAVSALADAEAVRGMVTMLRRTLSFIGPELDALSADVTRTKGGLYPL